MAVFNGLDAFAAFARAGLVRAIGDDFLKKQAEKVKDELVTEAKRVLGTYEYGWPRLAESTIRRKKEGDSPGLETGAMRDSVSGYVEKISGGYKVTVGSTDKHAVYFELGTAKQPPRPFLTGAMTRVAPKFAAELGHHAVKAITEAKG